jgi:2-dehydropantoate 2-reductase
MRFAIMGAGGVGGYYGARLAQAGHDVTYIARGDHLRAIRLHGMSLRGPDGEVVVRNVDATDDPAKLNAVDVILFCVKLFDTETAARALAPLHAKGGLCISLQNGVDGQDRIGAVLGADRITGGLAFVSALIESPGVIRYASTAPSVRFGGGNGRLLESAMRFRDACIAAGFGAEIVPDIRAAQWDKFVGLATNAALTSLVRMPAGIVYREPELVSVARAGFAEAADVARAMGIALASDIVERSLAAHQRFPPEMYASMYHDLIRGRPLELESLSGLIVRKGKELGVRTPVHAMAYACLKPYVNGKRSS